MVFGTSWLLYLHRYAFGFIKPAIAKIPAFNEEQVGILKQTFAMGSAFGPFSFGNGGAGAAVNAMAENLVARPGYSNLELGILDSCFSLSYSLSQFALGPVTDILGVRLMLPILMLLWIFGFLMIAWAPSFFWLKSAQVSLGLGQSVVFGNINRASRIWFPNRIRTTLQGLVGVFAGRAGGMCSGLIFGSLLIGMLGLDWQTAVYLFAGAGLMHAVIVIVFYRNSPHGHPGVNAAELALLPDDTDSNGAKKMRVGEMLRSLSPRGFANLGLLSVSSILSVIADSIYSGWIPTFVSQEHGMNYKQMGVMAALPLAGGAIGGFLGGYLNDLAIRRTGNRRWSRSGVAFAGKGMAAILLFVALIWYDRPYVFCSLLFFVKLFGDWSLVTSWAVVTDIGGKATATIFSFNNAIAILVGGTLAPLLFGYISDEFSWKIVFITAAVVYALCAVSWLFINCTIPMIKEKPKAP